MFVQCVRGPAANSRGLAVRRPGRAGGAAVGAAIGAARSTRQGVARAQGGRTGALFMRARKLCARLDRDERKRSGVREGGR